MIDNPDDAGVNRRLDGMERETRFFAADEEHFFSDTGTDRIHGNKYPPRRPTIRRQRLQDEELERPQVFVLARGDNVAHHPGDLHVERSCVSVLVYLVRSRFAFPSGVFALYVLRFIDLDRVDDADDGGIDRAVLEA